MSSVNIKEFKNGTKPMLVLKSAQDALVCLQEQQGLDGATVVLPADASFPEQAGSIVGNGAVEGVSEEDSGILLADGLQWLRPCRVGSGGTSSVTFLKDISPFQVKQGRLGDCYFMSAMAGLAEIPSRIQNLFVGHDFETGWYSVRFYVMGRPLIVHVNDLLPCGAENDIVFGSGNGDVPDIWAPLLEKAWAKASGSYHAIATGNAGESLRVLTGAPTDWIEHKKKVPPNLFSRIKDATEKRFVVCSSTKPLAEAPDIEDCGLSKSHCYTCLAAVTKETTVKTKKGKVKKMVELLKLRNPWGTNGWTGPWCDHVEGGKSGSEPERGIFYMTMADYSR
jgi:calpain-15